MNLTYLIKVITAAAFQVMNNVLLYLMKQIIRDPHLSQFILHLNPIRARMAATPETSEYTSIRARLQGDRWQRRQNEHDELHHCDRPIRPLMGFADTVEPTADIRNAADALPIRQEDYLQLVDATGRIASPGQRGRIAPSVAPILDRLGLSSAQWIVASTEFSQHYRNGRLRLKQTA